VIELHKLGTAGVDGTGAARHRAGPDAVTALLVSATAAHSTWSRHDQTGHHPENRVAVLRRRDVEALNIPGRPRNPSKCAAEPLTGDAQRAIRALDSRTRRARSAHFIGTRRFSDVQRSRTTRRDHSDPFRPQLGRKRISGPGWRISHP